jgi:hypothetical protein
MKRSSKFKLHTIKKLKARCQWLTLVIQATWETEIMRVTIQGQPSKKFVKPHFDGKKLGTEAHTCHFSERVKQEDWSRLA